MSPLDHRQLYRLPWSFSDNVISWLEPTQKCNLACEGCYRENVNTHRSLEEVESDLDVFEKFRKFDGVSIAGGDPLLHPNIVEIVERVTARGHKAVINTNGLALNEGLLRRLKKAGLVGVTFHVDSKQGRPGWKNKNELELNELRLTLAKMVKDVGGLSCAFNSTVYEDTLQYVPELVQFAQDNIELIHVMVFILYRAAVLGGQFEYYAGAKKVEADTLVYAEEAPGRVDISAREVVKKIQERFPDFAPSAYLGGTEKPDSFKWLLTGRIGTKDTIYGYVGPKFMEVVQETHHMTTGRYLAYTHPAMLGMGRSMMTLAPLDAGIRKAFGNYTRAVARNPLRALEQLHFQSIMMIQPIDIMEDGRQNMCDGCPDLTVDKGELVWSCRLEERRNYGQFLRCVPKPASARAKPPPKKELPLVAADGELPAPKGTAQA
jgi:hypothetical protein